MRPTTAGGHVCIRWRAVSAGSSRCGGNNGARVCSRPPAYYKEAAAWMRGVELSRVYAHGSKFPLRTYTDHLPLTFVRSTSGKGPVSQFILDHLSDIDYIIEYKRGVENTHADAISRYPCLGLITLRDEGVKEAIRALLDAVPATMCPTGRIWLYAQRETVALRPMLAQWQDERMSREGCLLYTSPSPRDGLLSRMPSSA